MTATAGTSPTLGVPARVDGYTPVTMKTLAAALVLAACSLAHAGDAPTDSRSWLVGTWHGVRRDGADGSEARMTSRYDAILDGAGLVERIEVTHGGGVYRGFATEVFDPGLSRWVRMYVNATRRHFARLEGEADAEGRVVWRSVSPDRSRETRVVTERLGPDRWRRTSSISEDGGKSWRVLFVDDLERDAKSPR